MKNKKNISSSQVLHGDKQVELNPAGSRIQKSSAYAKGGIADKIGDLMHEGTPEAIAKIKKHIAEEKDSDARAYGQIALDECEFFYYSPNSPRENKEFNLLKMIQKKELRVLDLEIRRGGYAYLEEQLSMEAEITKKLVAKTKNKKQAKQWKDDLLGIPEVQTWHRKKQEELKKEIDFLEAWVVEARRNITAEKYKNIPSGALSDIHHDYEGWEDDEND
jgi:hypothetical protein